MCLPGCPPAPVGTFSAKRMTGAIYRKITAEAAAHLHVRRAVLVALCVSLLTNACLALHVLFADDQTRTIVIAPDAQEPYVATHDTVSANLLERFCVGVLGLALNMTPQTGRWQSEAVLKHVAPESYAAIARELRASASELERNQASVAFFAHSAHIDTERKEVCLTGERRVMIARAVTDTARVQACARVDVRLGRMWIVQLQLTDATSAS